jgi:hypothetical protein
VEAYQLISGVYVNTLHERTKDMRVANTHAHARVFRVLRVIIAIASWHGVFNEQFIFVLHFFYYWLILPHLDCHVNHDWLHVERFHGAVLRIWAD